VPKTVLCGKPTEQMLIDRCKDYQEYLKERYPAFQYKIVYCFEPKLETSTACISKYNLGLVRIRRGLSLSQEFIG
jgi:hypothetical protein